MTQSSLQTQCPQCDTRFRVTEEQLSVAAGKVRCGNCMHVFNAVEHQVLPEASDDEDLVFEDNPEEDATERHYTGGKLTFSEDELSDSFRDFDQGQKPGFSADEPEEPTNNDDESWAEAILQEDEHESEEAYKKPAQSSPEDPEELTANSLDAKPEPDPDFNDLSLSATEDERLSSPEPSAHREPSASKEPSAQQPPSKSKSQPQEQPEPEHPDNSADLYRNLRHEPVAVSGGSGRLRKAVWSLAILALLGLLIAQVTWFQFDRLAAIPQLRPFYEQACELAGCELQPLVNVQAIESRKLVVRTNPDNRSQLIVDAVMVNRAGFEQPYPAIALTFSNLNGDVVAQSTFTPDEYLAEQAPEPALLPKDTPVRIAITIRDPGRDAVNYNLSFRPWAG
ncbi:MAG: zinc-ribbon domain-containing protein [Alteromonadaceae bacterium]|nr:zinc-ribbon domain-containing protein [Alteromonadaceae bacterium]